MEWWATGKFLVFCISLTITLREEFIGKVMVGKSTLIAASFSVFIAVLTLALMFALYQKWYVEPLYERYPEALHPYIDPYPFTSTKYGHFVLADNIPRVKF